MSGVRIAVTVVPAMRNSGDEFPEGVAVETAERVRGLS